MVKLRKIGFKTLIDIHVTLNPKDPQSLILKLKQPSWLFNKQYYNDSNFVNAYKTYMRKYLVNLNSSILNVNESLNRMFDLEKRIGMVIRDFFYFIRNRDSLNFFPKNLLNEDQKRNSTYKNMTIADLIREIPKVKKLELS